MSYIWEQAVVTILLYSAFTMFLANKKANKSNHILKITGGVVLIAIMEMVTSLLSFFFITEIQVTIYEIARMILLSCLFVVLCFFICSILCGENKIVLWNKSSLLMKIGTLCLIILNMVFPVFQQWYNNMMYEIAFTKLTNSEIPLMDAFMNPVKGLGAEKFWLKAALLIWIMANLIYYDKKSKKDNAH